MSFNSLYEIRAPSGGGALGGLRLSILFMRFNLLKHPVQLALDHFQFSLWDSYSNYCFQSFGREKTFNSLYEIR